MKKTNASALVVADTSGLMSLLVDTDTNYPKALALSRSLEESQGEVILTRLYRADERVGEEAGAPGSSCRR